MKYYVLWSYEDSEYTAPFVFYSEDEAQAYINSKQESGLYADATATIIH